MAVFKYKNGCSFAKTSATEGCGFLRRQLVISGSKGTIEINPIEWYYDRNKPFDNHKATMRISTDKTVEKGITLNGEQVTVRAVVRAGQILRLRSEDLESSPNITPTEGPLDIVYEDDDLIIVNKEAGMCVHPGHGNYSGTLVNALLYHCKGRLSGINGVLRPGIVHRIDKETAGLLVVAKTDAAHRRLAADLETHAVRREYRAVVRGNPKTDTGTIDRPIGRHPVDRKKMAIVADGRHAVTHYTVLERFRGAAYLHLSLETGRTHQIRVHMASEGHPLLFDVTYGGGSTPFEKRHPSLFDGQALHAVKLSFTHPTTGEPMEFHSPLSENFEKLLTLLRDE